MLKIKKNNVLLIVSGSIAAYKTPDIVRELKKYGKSVKVVLTEGALHFIPALNFKALGAEGVYAPTDSFQVDEKGISLHLSLSRWADTVLIAPATADFIAKLRNGFADSLPYSTLLAYNFKGPIFIAPAMNEAMFLNPITQGNIISLKEKGVTFIGPETGMLADGTIAKGRLSNIDKIAQTVVYSMNKSGPLSGKRILITCGPTREYIDPVRFITNGSSGTLGVNIAKRAKLMGAYVHLIAGEMQAPVPYVDKVDTVETTEDLLEKTRKAFKNYNIIIMTAAPVDFKPKKLYKSKIKKLDNLNIELTSTPDVLKTLSEHKGKRIIIGFALQTEELEKNALRKMNEKNMDIVVANSTANIGSMAGSATLIDKFGRRKRIINKEKEEIAKQILDFLKEYIDKEAKNG